MKVTWNIAWLVGLGIAVLVISGIANHYYKPTVASSYLPRVIEPKVIHANSVDLLVSIPDDSIESEPSAIDIADKSNVCASVSSWPKEESTGAFKKIIDSNREQLLVLLDKNKKHPEVLLREYCITSDHLNSIYGSIPKYREDEVVRGIYQTLVRGKLDMIQSQINNPARNLTISNSLPVDIGDLPAIDWSEQGLNYQYDETVAEARKWGIFLH